jgi:hypothetical protein
LARQGRQVRQGQRGHPFRAAAGPAVPEWRAHHRGRDAGDRDNARFLRQVKAAHFLWPVLGNQPGLSTLDALDWDNTPLAATIDTARGRIETRTLRVLPVGEGPNFPGAQQAILIERYVTVKKTTRG